MTAVYVALQEVHGKGLYVSFENAKMRWRTRGKLAIAIIDYNKNNMFCGP
jgi:hypothetical protein